MKIKNESTMKTSITDGHKVGMFLFTKTVLRFKITTKSSQHSMLITKFKICNKDLSKLNKTYHRVYIKHVN